MQFYSISLTMNNDVGCCFHLELMVKKQIKNTNLPLTARPSTDSIELLPFSSFFEGFVEELKSEKSAVVIGA